MNNLNPIDAVQFIEYLSNITEPEVIGVMRAIESAKEMSEEMLIHILAIANIKRQENKYPEFINMAYVNELALRVKKGNIAEVIENTLKFDKMVNNYVSKLTVSYGSEIAKQCISCPCNETFNLTHCPHCVHFKFDDVNRKNIICFCKVSEYLKHLK